MLHQAPDLQDSFPLCVVIHGGSVAVSSCLFSDMTTYLRTHKEHVREMKILASGIGAALPKTSIGFSLFSGVYIQLRRSSNDQPQTFGIASGVEIGGNSGTLIAGHIETAWMEIDTTKHAWLCSRSSLVGKLGEVELKGTLAFSGTVDVNFTIYDANNESTFSLSRIKVESKGGQLADTKIRGVIKDMMGKTQNGSALCAQP